MERVKRWRGRQERLCRVLWSIISQDRPSKHNKMELQRAQCRDVCYCVHQSTVYMSHRRLVDLVSISL